MKKILLAIGLLLISTHSLASDFATDVIAATHKLFHPQSTSTCFLVQGETEDNAVYLVTTAHSLEGMPGETAVLVLRENKSDGAYARRDHTLAIRRGEMPLWTKHPKEDLAVLRLTDPLPQPIRPLPFSAMADEERLKEEEIHTCSSLFVLTYPQRFEANDAGFPVARQGIVADHPFLPTPSNHRYLADFNTFAGDSGGPVFVKAKNGRPLVIGVVLARFNHDERIKTEYEERLIRHPLGLGSVLYPQLVRETIVAAKGKEAEPAK